MNWKRSLKVLALGLALTLPSLAAYAQQVNMYWNTGGCSAFSCWGPVSTANPLPVTGSFSSSIAGFPGTTQTTGTPISVTTGGVTGTLPAGTVVVASNVGSTNGAFCKLGASATTSDQLIPPNSWFGFTVGTNTQITCITSTSTTTVNLVGGAGLPTGSGGGGGGGSSSNITQTAGTSINAAIAATGALPVDTLTTGNLYTAVTAPIPVIAGTLPTTQSAVSTGATTKAQSDLNGNLYANLVSQYPAGSTPIAATATFTSGTTTATLTGTSTTTVYTCGYSFRANATAASNVTNTITGLISGTRSDAMWVAPLASGMGIDEQIYTPCLPASAVNIAVAAAMPAVGSGGFGTVNIWGYYK